MSGHLSSHPYCRPPSPPPTGRCTSRRACSGSTRASSTTGGTISGLSGCVASHGQAGCPFGGDPTQVSERDPSLPPWGAASDKAWQIRRMQVYAAMVQRMDEGIARRQETATGAREDRQRSDRHAGARGRTAATAGRGRICRTHPSASTRYGPMKGALRPPSCCTGPQERLPRAI